MRNMKSIAKNIVKMLGKIMELPAIDCGVAVKLKVFLDSWIVGDECGYQQAHGDIIQAHNCNSR